MPSFLSTRESNKSESKPNTALFYTLAVFALIFSIQGSVAMRTYDSVFIFKFELLFVLLYSFVNRNLPFSVIKSKKWLLPAVGLWLIYCLSLYLLDVTNDSRFDPIYAFKAFHGVFVVYALAVYAMYAGSESKNIRDQPQVLTTIVFALLCALTFSIALTGGSSLVNNSNLVFQHEVLFVLACVFGLKLVPDLTAYFANAPVISVLVTLWAVSVTISYLFSPLDIRDNSWVFERYDQTFMHLVFLMFVFEFLQRAEISKVLLPLMIPVSIAFVVLIYWVSWFQIPADSNVDWFLYPPLNGHIRYVGYLVAAATSIILAFNLFPRRFDAQVVMFYGLLLTCMTFLVWIGGRAAVGSAIIVLVALVVSFGWLGRLNKGQLFITCLMLVMAFFLAELFKVFDWNGFSGQLTKLKSIGSTSIVGSTSINEITTGRLQFWQTSIESLKGHWLFGLGPQGYYFMPNRVWGVQPHSFIVQFLVEWGVVGATLFLALLSWVGLKIIFFIKNSQQMPSVVFFSGAAVFLSLTIHGLVDGTYYHGQPSYYIALALALCLSEISIHHNENG